MAERGKPEESQHTETADLEETLREVLEGHGFTVVYFPLPDEDPSDVDVVAKLASPRIAVVPGTAAHMMQRASRVSRRGTDLLPELDEAVDRDDAYYDEVRQAVGRGAPTVLLGTSTKSLEANVRKIQAAQERGSPGAPPSDPTGRIRPRRWGMVALLLAILALALSTIILIGSWDQRSSLANALTVLLLITAWVVLAATAILSRYHKGGKTANIVAALLAAEYRHRAKKQADRLNAESSQIADMSPPPSKAESEQASKEKKG